MRRFAQSTDAATGLPTRVRTLDLSLPIQFRQQVCGCAQARAEHLVERVKAPSVRPNVLRLLSPFVEAEEYRPQPRGIHGYPASDGTSRSDGSAGSSKRLMACRLLPGTRCP